MADLKLDANGDLAIENGAGVIVRNGEALRQKLQIRLQFFLGEWFLDTRVGFPYFQQVFVKNPFLVFIRGLFRSAILTTPGVATLEEFDFSLDTVTRKLSFDFVVQSTDGELLSFDREFIIA